MDHVQFILLYRDSNANPLDNIKDLFHKSLRKTNFKEELSDKNEDGTWSITRMLRETRVRGLAPTIYVPWSS